MDTIIGWKKERDRKKRHVLSNNKWHNIILCLGSEGYLVEEIKTILTAGRIADQSIRDMWELGLGHPKWSAEQEKQAYNVTWEFFKRDIEELYHGNQDTKGQSTVNIQKIILGNTGFKLPSQSMHNQMEKVWGFVMRKRPRIKAEAPRTPTVKREDINGVDATVLSEGQDFQDFQDHKVKRDLRAESSTSFFQQYSPYQPQSTSNDTQYRCLENQILIMKEDFKAAMAIGRCQGTAMHNFEKQLQRLNDEVKSLKSENSALGAQINELQRKNHFLETQVDELLGLNKILHTGMDDLKTKNLELQQEVNELNALKLENQHLRTQKAVLQNTHVLLRHTISQLITKFQLFSNAPEDNLKKEVEKLGKVLGYLKFEDDSPRVSIDSGYFGNPDFRQSLNLVPVALQTPAQTHMRVYNQAAEVRDHLERNPKRRCYVKTAQVGLPVAMSDAESLPELAMTPVRPPVTGFELEEQSNYNWHNDPDAGMRMHNIEDMPIQEYEFPAGPVFTDVTAGFEEQWNDPTVSSPPLRIPNFTGFNTNVADEGFEDDYNGLGTESQHLPEAQEWL